MGYEIVYHFREEITKGEYAEEVKTKKQKVGSPYEDVSLESVAGKIMAQLARRNILVTDVEIYEFTRKKLSYKEADDGISIKNRKFRFEDGPVVSAEGVNTDDAQAQLAELLANHPHLLQTLQGGGELSPPPMEEEPVAEVANAIVRPKTQPKPARQLKKATGPRRVKKREIFDPPNPIIADNNKTLTVGKQYEVYEVEVKGIPPATRTFYHVDDDNGQTKKVSADYFVAPGRGKLSFEDEMVSDPTAPAPEIKLSYGDEPNFGMPDLRG